MFFILLCNFFFILNDLLINNRFENREPYIICVDIDEMRYFNNVNKNVFDIIIKILIYLNRNNYISYCHKCMVNKPEPRAWVPANHRLRCLSADDR